MKKTCTSLILAGLVAALPVAAAIADDAPTGAETEAQAGEQTQTQTQTRTRAREQKRLHRADVDESTRAEHQHRMEQRDERVGAAMQRHSERADGAMGRRDAQVPQAMDRWQHRHQGGGRMGGRGR